ncbi:MAG: DNA-binding Lrp family transcriptional regulator [Planctomycetota bacterium]|jgi:DNA-binding Lrp family transcriptional regulator
MRYMNGIDALDRIDFGILVALRKDARISNKELAALVQLAPSSCLERVRRLRSSGALRGFHADVDPEALGIGLEALISVRIQRHSRDQLEQFQAHVLSLPETTHVYHVAGANDFLVHVQVRDAAHLRDLALDSFTTRPEVEHMETNLIFSHRQSYLLPRESDA